MKQEEKPSEINEQTKFPLSIVAAIVAATITICGMFFSVQQELKSLREADFVTVHAWQVWSLELANQNPNLNIPGVDQFGHGHSGVGDTKSQASN